MNNIFNIIYIIYIINIMLKQLIKPRLTKRCVSSNNILDLCYSKIFDKNVIDIIKLYLIEYVYGKAFFNKEEYIINNEYVFQNIIGHPFNSIIRFISKYDFFNNTNIELNKILNNINKTQNHKIIDLRTLLKFFISCNINLECLNRPCTIKEVFDLLINYIENNNNNNFNTMVSYIHNNDIKQVVINKQYKLDSTNIINNLKDSIIIESGFRKSETNIYSKSLILNNKIITFQIKRSNVDDNYLFEVPIILDLPSFTFYKNKKSKYILISAILRNDSSIVILEKSGKYFHYTHNKAIILKDTEFNSIINHKAIFLFYKKIN
jgi:hypothetical protein